jgi:outer membrane immunogenic protein
MERLGPSVMALTRVASALAVLAAASAVGVPLARAADLPVPAKPGYYPPTYAPAIYNWTGIYLGGNVGVGMLSDSIAQSAPGPSTPVGTATLRPFNVIGGGQIGANYQFGSWVVGAEGALSSTNISGTGNVLTTTPSTESTTSAPHWLASATGRFGYAADTLLVYVKGGGAWMNVAYSQAIQIGGLNVIGPQRIDDTRSGFTAGVGLEYGLTENFSARLEYDFNDFGSKSYNFNQTPVSIRSDLHVLAFGLNYRFVPPGGSPVAAKY